MGVFLVSGGFLNQVHTCVLVAGVGPGTGAGPSSAASAGSESPLPTATAGTDALSTMDCSLATFVESYDTDGNCAIGLSELGRASADFANTPNT